MAQQAMKPPSLGELRVGSLGPCRYPSPLSERSECVVDETRRVLLPSDTAQLQASADTAQAPPSFESAGPRPSIFFEPAGLRCGIVTCGGLCPGVNDVIRSVVLTLTYGYGVEHVLGFRYGYAGLSSRKSHEPVQLTPNLVDTIHTQGGTILGSSRGPQDAGDMVDTLERLHISILFAVGGDGTLRGASAIVEEIRARGRAIAVVGIPKTIDNDLLWMQQSFGFSTAVEEARKSIAAAHAEARGAWNGIGLVKLMGRESGFIAAHATLANSDVNFCLVPEVRFRLAGDSGFLHALVGRLERKHHAVIVVAEGAAQHLLRDPAHVDRDASGNVKLGDIGHFLCAQIETYLQDHGIANVIKYIDPSYLIRSLPANSLDSAFCLILGQHAVHAGMAGKTDMLVGFWNQRFTNVPIHMAVQTRKHLNPNGEIWPRVLEATRQPAMM